MTNEVANVGSRAAARKALKAMKPGLSTLFAQLQKDRQEVDNEDIWARWNEGKRLSDSTQDPEAYGDTPIELLADALCCGTQDLYRSLAFFNCFEKEQVTEILAKKSDTGYSLKWSHLSEICRLSNAAGRMKLVSTAIKSNLSVREIIAEVQKLMGGKRGNNQSGRPRKGIKTPQGAVNVLIKQTTQDANVIAEVGAQMDTLLDQPAQHVSEELMVELDEAEAQANTIIAAYTEILNKIKAARAAGAKVLKFKNNQAEAAAEESEEEEPVQEAKIPLKKPALKPKK